MSKEYMSRVCLFLPPRQIEALRVVSSQCQLSVSELIRRSLDNALREPTLNQIVPAMSGQFSLVR